MKQDQREKYSLSILFGLGSGLLLLIIHWICA